MSIEKVNKTLQVGKESSEIADVLGDLISDIKAGKDAGLILAENIKGLMGAIDGFEKLGEEAKDESRLATGAYASYVIAKALSAPSAKKEEKAAPKKAAPKKK